MAGEPYSLTAVLAERCVCRPGLQAPSAEGRVSRTPYLPGPQAPSANSSNANDSMMVIVTLGLHVRSASAYTKIDTTADHCTAPPELSLYKV